MIKTEERLRYLIEQRKEILVLKQNEFKDEIKHLNVEEINSCDILNLTHFLERLAVDMAKIEGSIQELQMHF